MQRLIPLWSLIVTGMLSLLAGIGVASLIQSQVRKGTEQNDTAPRDASAELERLTS